MRPPLQAKRRNCDHGGLPRGGEEEARARVIAVAAATFGAGTLAAMAVAPMTMMGARAPQTPQVTMGEAGCADGDDGDGESPRAPAPTVHVLQGAAPRRDEVALYPYRFSNSARTAGIDAIIASVCSAWPTANPLPMTRSRSLPTPSAPSAAFVKLVDMAKK